MSLVSAPEPLKNIDFLIVIFPIVRFELLDGEMRVLDILLLMNPSAA